MWSGDWRMNISYFRQEEEVNEFSYEKWMIMSDEAF